MSNVHSLKSQLALFPLLILLLVGIFSTTVDAIDDAPFDFKTNGVLITNYEIDTKDTELILDVEVTDKVGTVEINFEREFFDSVYKGTDDDFTIIAEGELVNHKEIHSSINERTLQFNLVKGTEQVEIFGTKLMGFNLENKQVNEKSQIIETKPDKSNQLLNENEKLIKENNLLKEEKNFLKEENELLKIENEKLDSRIFELENLVSSLEHQVKNLNALVMEQVKVIYNWVLGSPTS